MSAVAPSRPSAPRLGAVAIRRTPRHLLAALVALLALATVTHHLVPEHGAMSGSAGIAPPASALHHAAGMSGGEVAHHGDAPAPRSDHAMPMMVACLGIVGAGFLLAYVGAIVRVRRPRRRRPAASRAARRSARLPGRAACRDGPPTFLRLQVLRT